MAPPDVPSRRPSTKNWIVREKVSGEFHARPGKIYPMEVRRYYEDSHLVRVEKSGQIAHRDVSSGVRLVERIEEAYNLTTNRAFYTIRWEGGGTPRPPIKGFGRVKFFPGGHLEWVESSEKKTLGTAPSIRRVL